MSSRRRSGTGRCVPLGALLSAALLPIACAAPGEDAPPSATAGRTSAAASAPRLAVPAGLSCPRDRLTSYAGTAETLTLGPPLTRVTIRTDWGTVETVELRHADRAAAERAFRLHGGPFDAADWATLQRAAQAATPRLRAIGWVCEDGRTPPIIDWRPGEPTVPAR